MQRGTAAPGAGSRLQQAGHQLTVCPSPQDHTHHQDPDHTVEQDRCVEAPHKGAQQPPLLLPGLSSLQAETAAQVTARGLWGDNSRVSKWGATLEQPLVRREAAVRCCPPHPWSCPDLLPAGIQRQQGHKERHLQEEVQQHRQGCVEGKCPDSGHVRQGTCGARRGTEQPSRHFAWTCNLHPTALRYPPPTTGTCMLALPLRA